MLSERDDADGQAERREAREGDVVPAVERAEGEAEEEKTRKAGGACQNARCTSAAVAPAGSRGRLQRTQRWKWAGRDMPIRLSGDWTSTRNRQAAAGPAQLCSAHRRDTRRHAHGKEV